MRTIGDTIKLLRESSNLTQDQLANALHISRSALGMYESNQRTPKHEILEAIADYFNVDMDYLFGKTDIRNAYKALSDSMTSKIPLYASISCGRGMFVDDEIEDYIAIPDKYLTPGVEYFANTAHGDSMIGKGIKDGDVLVFERTSVLENGMIGSFCIDNEKAYCKIYRHLPNGMIMLESANDKYDPIMIDVTNECFRIIGRYKFKFSIEQ